MEGHHLTELRKEGYEGRRFKRVELARIMGLSPTTLEQYEIGYHRGDGRPVRIPRVFALALSAVLAGLPPYGDPPETATTEDDDLIDQDAA